MLGSLGEAIEVELPPYTVAGRVEELLGDLARNVERQGVPFGTFLAQTGRSMEQVTQALLPDAIGSLRRELALEAFAEREDIVVDDDELESALRDELADEEDVDAAVQEVLASRAKEAARDELQAPARARPGLRDRDADHRRAAGSTRAVVEAGRRREGRAGGREAHDLDARSAPLTGEEESR